MLAVGVPMETVINDYMKTNEYTKEFVDDYLKKIKLYSLNQADVDQLRPIMGVEERFIVAAMDRIIEDVKDIGKVETSPKFEGKQMIMVIQPN